MILFAANGRGAFKPLTKQGDIQFQRQLLNVEQRKAIVHILTSSDKVMLIRGAAGTGKTTLTQEAVTQINKLGKQVVMLAPSAQASRGVLRDEGFSEADTLAKFLDDPQMQAQAEHGFIWLDEASLVGTKSMAELFRLADKLDARIILSGDQYQHGSIERGAALRTLESIAKLPVAHVTEIQRQQTAPYKAAVKELSVGKIAEGFKMLDEQGAIKVLPVWDKYDAVAKEYLAKRAQVKNPDKDVLIVSPTHAESAQVTAAVRNELRKQGMLGAVDHEYNRLIPLQWTAAQRGDWSNYTGEEVIQFHRNSGPFKAGERTTISAGGEALKKIKAKNFSVYLPGTISLTNGDSIRVTANGKTHDGHRLNNGATYTVKNLLPNGDIRLSNNWVVDHDFMHISSGITSTSHAAQGRTCEHVLVVDTAQSYPASSQSGFYVAASRGRKSLTIFTDDKRTLLEAVSRNDRHKSALEIFGIKKPNILQRAQQSIRRLQQRTMIAAKELVERSQEPQNSKEQTYER